MSDQRIDNETAASQREHTPGPWYIEKWTAGTSSTFVKKPGRHTSIAEAFVHFDGYDEAYANARLIAAAPALLAAAEGLSDFFGTCPAAIAAIGNSVPDLVAQLREAIALAKGGAK